MPAPSRGPAERFQTWLVTGPLGHLWSVVADLAVFAAGELWSKVRRRLRDQRRLDGRGSRPSDRR